MKDDLYSIIVQHYEEGHDDLAIKLPWKAQDLSFDKDG